MIKTVTKSNGEVVAFDVDKFNRVNEYAAQQNVDWSTLSLDVLDQLYDGISTKEIIKTMIQVLEERKTTAHLKVAATLLAGDIYKTVYGSYSPKSFSQFYKEMVELGKWKDYGLSTKELSILDESIDHSRDFTYELASLKQFIAKYALGNYDKSGKKTIFESPQMTFMGIAVALFAHEKHFRVDYIVRFYDKISTRKTSISTPILASARTGKNGFASCAVMTADDNLGSIGAANVAAYELTANRSGIGIEFNTRSIGDDVANGKCTHFGKIPQYKALVASIKTIAQGGRGGAATTFFNVLDPEFFDICRAKLTTTPEDKRELLIDYGCVFNKEFLKRYVKNEPWLLVSKFDAPDLHEAFYEKRSEFGELLNKYIEKGSVGKVVSTREMLHHMLSVRSGTGRIYPMNIDEVNDHTPFKDTIRQSNLCFTGDTLVAVADGRNAVSIKELAEQSKGTVKFPVYSAHENNHNEVRTGWKADIKNAVAFKTGTHEVIKIVLSNGDEFECTPEHELALFGGGWVMAKDAIGCQLADFFSVNEGKYRIINSFSNGHTKQHRMIYEHNYGKLPKKGTHIDHIDDSKGDFIENLQALDAKVHREKSKSGQVGKNNAVHKIKDKERYSNNLKYNAFGVNNPNSNNLSDLEIIELGKKVIALFGSGISNTRLRKEMKELDERSPINFSKNRFGGDTDKFKRIVMGLEEYIASVNVEYKEKAEVKRVHEDVFVADIVKTGKVEDVYDLHVEDNHNFYIITSGDEDYKNSKGVLVHNCMEICLPTKGYKRAGDLDKPYVEGEGLTSLCFLMALDVAKIENDDDYFETAYITCRALDNVIEVMDYPYLNVEQSSKAWRNLGIGMTNMAYLLAKSWATYDTGMARNFIHKIAERHQYALYKASVELAKERGTFAMYHRTKYADENGYTVLDSYNKNIDKHHSAELKYDWEKLKADIVEHGVRFSTHSAHMPAESSGVLGNSTNGLYPIRKGVIVKSQSNLKTTFIAPEWEFLKNQYQKAWDVSSNDLSKVYGIVQKFTDQAISSDTYEDLTKPENIDEHGNAKVSMKKMVKDFLFAFSVGMKTQYYRNTYTEEVKHLEESEDNVEIVEDGACDGACKF